jgi:hypothetical protein
MTTLTTEQKINLTVTPETALGKPSTITGMPLWSSSNINSISLVIAPDGLSAYAIGGVAGTSTISVIANAGTDAVPVQISSSIDITVTTAPASMLVITASEPVSQ